MERLWDEGSIVWSYMCSSEASVRFDSLDSTSIRVRRQSQQRRRVQIIDLNSLEWCFSADIVTPTASTRPRIQSKSERCLYYSVEATCPRLNRLDSCKKPVYFMISLAKKGELSSPRPPTSRLEPWLSLINTYSYTTQLHHLCSKSRNTYKSPISTFIHLVFQQIMR